MDCFGYDVFYDSNACSGCWCLCYQFYSFIKLVISMDKKYFICSKNDAVIYFEVGIYCGMKPIER